MNSEIRNLGELDRVIHEPGRLMITALLFAVEQADFLYLQYETSMNKGTLSSHISKLEEAGYVNVRKTFRGEIPQTILRLTPAGRKAFAQYRRNLTETLSSVPEASRFALGANSSGSVLILSAA
jgi:DNA-binding MarR family transcriptional regulator